MKIKQIHYDNIEDYIEQHYRKDKHFVEVQGKMYYCYNTREIGAYIYKVSLLDGNTTFATVVYWAYNYKNFEHFKNTYDCWGEQIGECNRIVTKYIRL